MKQCLEMAKTALAWLVFGSIMFGVMSLQQAHAQTSAQADVSIQYTMPTLNTDQTPIPTTGPNSLAKVRIFLSKASIPSDVSTLTPTLETTPGTSAIVPSFSASIGDTIHARVQVCNVAGVCGPASNEATGVITAATPGSVALNKVTITVK